MASRFVFISRRRYISASAVAVRAGPAVLFVFARELMRHVQDVGILGYQIFAGKSFIIVAREWVIGLCVVQYSQENHHDEAGA